MQKTTVTKKRSTREILLDVAEELFTEHGFEGASVREITDHAGTRLASVNYHFGTKKSLFVAVILRRATVLSEDRQRMLKEIEIEPSQPKKTLKKLVEAFVYPLFLHSTKGDPGWKNYCRLIAQASTFKKANEDNTVQKAFDPTAREFIALMSSVFPAYSEQETQYSYQFMLGTTLFVFTENLRLDSLSNGKLSSNALTDIYPKLIEYICGGILNISQ